MASTQMKLFPSTLPPAPWERRFPLKLQITAVASKRVLVPCQVKKSDKATIQVSRRDIMQYAAATPLVSLALLFIQPAEARVGKLENKRKTMEKLEKLRQESETSKPKAGAPQSQPLEENELPIFPLLPLSCLAEPLVEATLSNN